MSTQGYIPKDLSFDDDGRQKLIQGITAISKAVKSTLGPLGKTVLIESPDHLSGITITSFLKSLILLTLIKSSFIKFSSL